MSSELSAERLFLQVVESGSFKKAAEQLRLEASSVSRKVAALEHRLKVKLLRRSTQRTSVTELGQIYYEKLRRIVDEHDALEEQISSGVEQLNGRLRISAPVDFGTRFVVPTVRRMQQQAPSLNIELLLGSQIDNLLEKNLDLAVRIGELPDSNLIAKKLGTNERVLVASPAYLAQHGTPTQVQQLAEHNFVLYSSTQASNDIVFANGTRFSHTRLSSNITVNSVSAVRYLVLDGAGIHLGPRWAFKEDLDSGAVKQLLPDNALEGFPIYAVYLAKSYLPYKTRVFTELLAESLQAG